MARFLFTTGFYGSVLAWLVCATAAPALAQPSDDTPPSVQIVGGGVTLRINQLTGAGVPLDANDSNTVLQFKGINGTASKVTLEAYCPGQSFRLYLRAELIQGQGTVATQEFSLTDGMFPFDLVLMEHRAAFNAGEARLHYRANATISDGNSDTHGNDAHTITFTVTAQ